MKYITKENAIRFVIAVCIISIVFTGCRAFLNGSSTPAASKNNDLIRNHLTDHEYRHKDKGYYNIADSDVRFELIGQVSGTCWLCASACSLMTSYQLDHDGMIDLDQISLLNEVYDDDKEEGVFIAEGVKKEPLGGMGIFVLNELNQGFGDGLVIDGAIDARDWTIDEIKNGIRRYGALYIGIPDNSSKKGNYDNYYTMNCPDPKEGAFDHSIAVLGWDDNFPKEYFHDTASGNGAWITYNSNYPLDYYYISYDTPFDQVMDTPLFMSVTDDYSKVLSHDCGWWNTASVNTGGKTTMANVFKGEGTLAAVGTYVLADHPDLTIRIMTPDLTQCLYSRDYHADRSGYYVFDLETPMKVDEYAITVTYPCDAPVEGESVRLDRTIRVDVTSKKGQSFIQVDGKWLDMSEAPTWERLGCVTNNACIKALYVK